MDLKLHHKRLNLIEVVLHSLDHIVELDLVVSEDLQELIVTIDNFSVV